MTTFTFYDRGMYCLTAPCGTGLSNSPLLLHTGRTD